MLKRSPSFAPAFRFGGVRMAAALLVALCFPGVATERKTILFLQQAGPEREAMAQFLTHYQDELARLWPDPVFLRIEEIDAAMPSDAKLRDWLKRKYERVKIDLIAAVEGPGSSLSVVLRRELRPEIPVVVTGAGDERREYFASQPNLTQVLLNQDVRGLLEAARRLCPGTQYLFFTPSGIKTTEAERAAYRRDAEEFAAAQGWKFTDLTAPEPMASLLEKVRAMPTHSILLRRESLVGGVQRASAMAEPRRQFSEAASSPLFSAVDAWAEDGSTGTGSVDYAKLGAEMAAQTVAVFHAGDASVVPPVKSQAFTLSFDWRQLQRWGLDEKHLPPGSTVRFRTPGLWEQHRGAMIGITAALAVQTALIIALILQRRWRQLAEAALRVQREQLSHTLRLATISQMASSLAHELNQPLTAIVNNAGTAQSIMAKGRTDAAVLGEILQDITDDGHRAGEVIRNIRGMVRPDGGARTVVQMNELVAGVQRMVAAEFRARDADLTVETADSLPPLEANAVQMQQVLLNLVMNALEALDMPGTTARRVIMRTEAEGESAVLVSVRDFGPGLPAEGPEKLFEQYYTTKPDGMGMGLVIVRSLVEAHGGTLVAASAEGGGARFLFRLPAPAASQHESSPGHSHR